ncbi:MAG: putative Histidine kinase [Promethearchaeota archaeon]|nr:MAG: putative Histidine kinase [Candidatus Lokiarchaeota archaeon]
MEDNIELEKLKWMLKPKQLVNEDYSPYYGDVTKLNTERLLLDSCGKDVFDYLVNDFLDLLSTSVAVYELNGDYAYGIFSSGWCRLLDQSSRKLCDTDNNEEALQCGKWICHDSCWETAYKAIKTQTLVDADCEGGINLYAVPIYAFNKVVGCIICGYGNPPENLEVLKDLSETYKIELEDLIEVKEAYEPRPIFLIELAKRRIKMTAKMLGKMVELGIREQELEESKNQLNKAYMREEFYKDLFTHDMKNILQNFSMGLDLCESNMKQSENKEKCLNLLSIMKDQVLRGKQLVRNVRDLSAIEGSEMTLKEKEIFSILKNVIKRIKKAYQTRIARIKLNATETTYFCSVNQLIVDVFENLLINAIIHNENDEVIITVNLKKKIIEDQNYIKIEFIDNALGIREHRKKEIFERSITDLESRKRGGLGLFLVSKIMKIFGGKIWVENRVKNDPSQGSNFIILLPES